MQSVRNVLGFARKRGSLRILLDKLVARFFDTKGSLSHGQNLDWLASTASQFEEIASQVDQVIWQEALRFSENLSAQAEARLKPLEVQLGGGGHYAMLYFLTRLLRPSIIVETGVAAGYSSESFLSAIERNGKGELYSSDFPYIRIASPEQYIGLLVAPKHRETWSLHIEGDAKNLKKILAEIETIDLFHYDSDKRFRSKQRSYRRVRPRLGVGAHCIFDDIQDDSFFHDLVAAEGVSESDWDVIAYQGKYIGWLHPGWEPSER